MVVHSHEAGQHRVAVEIECLRVGGYLRGSAGLDGLDLSITDNNRLFFLRSGAGAIDHAYVGQSDHGRLGAYELLSLGSLCEGVNYAKEEQKKWNFCFHSAPKIAEAASQRAKFSPAMTIPFVVAISIVLGLLFFLIREVRRPPGPMQWGRTPRWGKRLRVSLGTIILLLGLLLFWAFLIEPNRLVVREHTIQIDNWPKELSGLRVAVVADIHAGGAFIDDKKLRTIVQRTNQLQPELIVLLGDYMSGEGRTSHQVEPEVFAATLKDFKAPMGVYSVLGNHDWWYDGARVRRALEENGIKVLENEVAQVNARGTSMWLAGLSDLWTRPQRIDETIEKVPQGASVIALTHNPDIFPKLPQRVPLLLAGHTHGGQVRFPLIGTVVHSSRVGKKYERGHVLENNHHLFVSTGIGTSILPVRFGVTPEIVLLTLNPK